MKKTKIVATLGPSTSDIEVIKALIKAGVDGARLNFSHGSHDSHGQMIDKLKQAREELKKPVALILDTKGPEIRLKSFKDGSALLEAGKTFTITTDEVEGSAKKVSTTYKGFPQDMKAGDKILLDDGLIELKVKEVKGNDIICIIINGGTIKDNKGVNVPDTYINLPSLTERDIEDIKFGIKMGIDYVAASFIRSAEDVKEIRRVLEKNGGDKIRIISKIENREGVKNFDAILSASDGIMVARGDMGVEINPEEVPVIQKELIRKSNIKGKLVITATQMLESMIHNPRPTRAEANDVANAIFDGTDCVMLSGETAGGKYPVQAVEMMARIAFVTEGAIDYHQTINSHKIVSESDTSITDAIAYAACTISSDLKAAAIATATNSGFTARMVSKFRPDCPIIALTEKEGIGRHLNLYWGVTPVFCRDFGSNEEVTNKVLKSAENLEMAQTGDSIVIVAGFPIGIAGTTNTIKVSTVGDVLLKCHPMKEVNITARACVIHNIDEAVKNFREGDIIVAKNTTPELMPLMVKASAIIVGSTDDDDYENAIATGKALDIPVIVCKENVDIRIKDGALITIDSQNGIIYNGIREV